MSLNNRQFPPQISANTHVSSLSSARQSPRGTRKTKVFTKIMRKWLARSHSNNTQNRESYWYKYSFMTRLRSHLHVSVYSFKICFNIVLPSASRSSNVSISQRNSLQSFLLPHTFHMSPPPSFAPWFGYLMTFNYKHNHDAPHHVMFSSLLSIFQI